MVPRLSLAEAGVSHVDRVRPCVEAARGLFSESLWAHQLGAPRGVALCRTSCSLP